MKKSPYSCNRCKRDIPRDAEHFSRHAKSPDGFTSWCRKCHSEYDASRRIPNPRTPIPALDRLMAKVDKTSGCWVWGQRTNPATAPSTWPETEGPHTHIGSPTNNWSARSPKGSTSTICVATLRVATPPTLSPSPRPRTLDEVKATAKRHTAHKATRTKVTTSW